MQQQENSTHPKGQTEWIEEAKVKLPFPDNVLVQQDG
jgi:hypothetical protein